MSGFFVQSRVSAQPFGGSKLKSVLPGQKMLYPAFASSSVNSGGGTTSFDRMWWLPIVVGYIPVIKPERVGAQTGACVKARANRVPCAANASRFGVIASASP